MKKRIFLFLIVASIVVSLFVFPVCAAEEYTYHFSYSADMNGYISFDPHPSSFDGLYSATFFFDGISVSWDSRFMTYSLNGIPYFVFPVVFDGSFAYFSFYFIQDFDSGESFVVMTSLSDPEDIPDDLIDVTLVLTHVPGTPFIDDIAVALSTTLDWLGSVIKSIVSGYMSGLFPVLAVGIAVAAVFLVVKIIRKFAWGS